MKPVSSRHFKPRKDSNLAVPLTSLPKARFSTWADDTCGAGACYDALVAWSLCTQNIYDCYKCSEHIQKIEGVFTLVFDPPEINGGIDCGFLCPATDGPPVPSFVDDQDEDEPEDQSEDQDADADEPEDQSEDQSEGD